MSIFKKKGTVESLFRFGLGDAADEDRPAPVAQAQADADARDYSSGGEEITSS